MKRNIFIGLGVIVLLLVIGVGYIMLTTKSHSPFKETTANFNGTDVTVGYCQPFKKDRLIFGNDADGALVPYGKYWRLGANEATVISFSTDVNFGGEKVAAGTYIMYAVPGEDSFDVYLNTEVGRWGAREADHSLDVTKISAPTSEASSEVEQFTINLTSNADGGAITFEWDKTVVTVPVTL